MDSAINSGNAMSNMQNGNQGERYDFSKIRTSVRIPNLIEVQRESYDRFLQMDLLPP
jgi:DNA-directed RNA polymerase subunit beta